MQSSSTALLHTQTFSFDPQWIINNSTLKTFHDIERNSTAETPFASLLPSLFSLTVFMFYHSTEGGERHVYDTQTLLTAALAVAWSLRSLSDCTTYLSQQHIHTWSSASDDRVTINTRAHTQHTSVCLLQSFSLRHTLSFTVGCCHWAQPQRSELCQSSQNRCICPLITLIQLQLINTDGYLDRSSENEAFLALFSSARINVWPTSVVSSIRTRVLDALICSPTNALENNNHKQ